MPYTSPQTPSRLSISSVSITIPLGVVKVASRTLLSSHRHSNFLFRLLPSCPFTRARYLQITTKTQSVHSQPHSISASTQQLGYHRCHRNGRRPTTGRLVYIPRLSISPTVLSNRNSHSELEHGQRVRVAAEETTIHRLPAPIRP